MTQLMRYVKRSSRHFVALPYTVQVCRQSVRFPLCFGVLESEVKSPYSESHLLGEGGDPETLDGE